jgi:hypothetical protein
MKVLLLIILCLSLSLLPSCTEQNICEPNQVDFLLGLNLKDTLSTRNALDSLSKCDSLTGYSLGLIALDYLLIGEIELSKKRAFELMKKDSTMLERSLECIYESYRKQKIVDSSLFYFEKYLKVETGNLITDKCSENYMKGSICFEGKEYHKAFMFMCKAIELYPADGRTLTTLENLHTYNMLILNEVLGGDFAEQYARKYLDVL